MAYHTGPKIVTDGLVLCLDAADRNSYPGSGTSWLDLSGNSNNGTLTNSLTFNNSNGGSFVFNEGNDKVIVPYSSSLNPSNVTISVWFKRNSTVNYSHFASLPAFYGSWGNPYNSYGIEFIGTTDQPSLVLGFSDNTFSYTTAPASASTVVGLWVNVVGTYNGSFSKIYVNGQLMTSNTQTKTLFTTSANFVLGAETEGTSSYPLVGNIAQVSVYNKALSADEIRQNYNATKGRFNLLYGDCYILPEITTTLEPTTTTTTTTTVAPPTTTTTTTTTAAPTTTTTAAPTTTTTTASPTSTTISPTTPLP